MLALAWATWAACTDRKIGLALRAKYRFNSRARGTSISEVPGPLLFLTLPGEVTDPQIVEPGGESRTRVYLSEDPLPLRRERVARGLSSRDRALSQCRGLGH